MFDIEMFYNEMFDIEMFDNEMFERFWEARL